MLHLARAIGLACLALLISGLPLWGAAPPAQQEEIIYIIHLKNGSQLRTSRYCEAGGEYRIEIFDGVVGINKSYVARIETIRRGSELVASPSAAPPAAPGPAAPGGFFSQVTSAVQELMDWMRGLMARLWSPRRPAGEGLQAGEGQPEGPGLAAGGGPAGRTGTPTRGGAPSLPVSMLVLAAVIPSFLFGGKALGEWLFAPRRA